MDSAPFWITWDGNEKIEVQVNEAMDVNACAYLDFETRWCASRCHITLVTLLEVHLHL